MISIYAAILYGLVLGVLSLGVYVAFRIMNAPDMTIDGSFTLGAAGFIMVSTQIDSYLGIILGIIVAIILGFLSGCITGILHTKLNVPIVLAGILVMTMLYSINLRITDKKTSIFVSNQIFSNGIFINILIAFIIVTIISILLMLFFKTFIGRSIRATGDNEEMVKASSINSNLMKVLGLGLANMLAGLSGALYCQALGFYDSTSGNGMMVLGVAGIIIGETIFLGKKNINLMIVAAVIGSIIYRIIYALALKIGVDSVDLKLISAVIVILAISIPVIRKKVKKC